MNIYKIKIKRLLDLIISFSAIILLSPLFIFVAILVKVNLGSPIIFKQKRPGLNEEIFTMYKFRTMNDKRNEDGILLPDSERITNFGRFLRKTSLDELPELFNILKGEMSIVGPRPLAVIYLPHYSEDERLRHTVRPGLTGLAQINGRNSINWEERFKFDLLYINDVSFKNDLMIILTTVKKVFKREGVALRGTSSIIDFHVYREKQNETLQQKMSSKVKIGEDIKL